jgi:NADH-quinone oxidoreductase subunit I
MAWGLGILKGMATTMKNMLRGPITVQYPHERLPIPERSRWAVHIKRDAAGAHRCTACTNCVRACPDKVLWFQVTPGADKTKHIDAFGYEIGACMFCGMCVEACTFDAIEMSDEYELAVVGEDNMVRLLLEDVAAAKPARAGAAAKPAAEPAADKAPAPPAAESAEPAAEPKGGDDA